MLGSNTICKDRKQIFATRSGGTGWMQAETYATLRAGVGHVRSLQVTVLPLTPPVAPRDIVKGKAIKNLCHRRERPIKNQGKVMHMHKIIRVQYPVHFCDRACTIRGNTPIPQNQKVRAQRVAVGAPPRPRSGVAVDRQS